MEVNIGLKQLDIGLQQSEMQYKQALYNFLPSVSGSANYSQVFGRYFAANGDVFTLNNQSATMGFNASIPIFQGGTLHYRRKSAEIDWKAQGYSIEKTKQDLTNQIVMLYFQIIFNTENYNISNQRVELLEKQLKQVELQYEAGRKTEADIYNVKSQIASEKVNRLNFRTQRDKDMLSMRQTMLLDAHAEFTLVKPAIDSLEMAKPLPTIDEVYQYAVVNMPQMKERMLKVASAEYNYKSTKAQLYPSLTFSAGLNDSYTPNATFSNFVIQGQQTQTFGEQLRNNLKQNFGLSLSIPVFERMQKRTSINSSLLSVQNARFDYVQQQNQLLKDIQQAHFDAQAAREKYLSAKEQLSASSIAFDFAKKKYDAGLIDFYVYLESLNNRTRGEVELLNAKYDFIVKSRILDIFAGKPMETN